MQGILKISIELKEPNCELIGRPTDVSKHKGFHSYNYKNMKKTQNLTFFSILEIKKSQIKKKTILWILANTYLSVCQI